MIVISRLKVFNGLDFRIVLKLEYINPDYRQALEKAGVLNEQAILNWDRGTRFVAKEWTDVFRCTIDGLGNVYVKRYFPPKNKLLGAFRTNNAVREYRSSAAMERIGIPQAEPVLAAAVYGGFGRVKCGIFIMREVENAVSLDKILEQCQDKADGKLLKPIADELIRLLAVMHSAGFCHWDFKPRNLLVIQQPNGVIIAPIDSRSGKRMCFLTRQACIKRDYKFLLAEPLLKPLILEAKH